MVQLNLLWRVIVLILSRKEDEKIEIYVPGFTPIVIQVVDIRGNVTRLGINADKAIKVHRSEVARAIERKGEQIGGAQ